MATYYVIDSDNCISCGACEVECPNGAISEGADSYVIDTAKCEGCADCVSSCPNDAIHPA
jgi:ferredoxin